MRRNESVGGSLGKPLAVDISFLNHLAILFEVGRQKEE